MGSFPLENPSRNIFLELFQAVLVDQKAGRLTDGTKSSKSGELGSAYTMHLQLTGYVLAKLKRDYEEFYVLVAFRST